MDHPRLMRGFEGLGNLLGEGECFIEWDRSSLDPIRQRRSFDEFKDQRTDSVGFF